MKVAVVGSGQLARMMALSGWPMGIEFRYLVQQGDSLDPIQSLGEVVYDEDYPDAEALYRALGEPDVITVEKEAVDTERLKALQAFCPVYPDPKMLETCRHRGLEKSWINEQGVDVAPYRRTGSRQDILEALEVIGYPAILKTCTGGYDGYGQWRIKTTEDAAALDEDVCRLDCVLEGFVDFKREVSLIAVRNAKGDVRFYPLTENLHRSGTLLTSKAPAPNLTPELQQQAEEIGNKLLTASNYVGVLAIEFFVTEGKGVNEEASNGQDHLVVNEMAPRVHNSGHWTQLGCISSQFNNHLRAITGLPIGNTQALKISGMVNLLGVDIQPTVLVDSEQQLHGYGKSLRPGRKMGHINLVADSYEALDEQLKATLAKVYPQG